MPGRKYLNVQKGVKTKVNDIGASIPKTIYAVSHMYVGVFGSLHEVPLSIEKLYLWAWLVIGTDYCKVECGHARAGTQAPHSSSCLPCPCPCPSSLWPALWGAKPCPYPCSRLPKAHGE